MTAMKLEQAQAGSQTEASPFSKTGRVLLSATGLRKAFGGQVVLNNLDLELREGEIVLLRGDNGCGKTTLLNILTGNVAPDEGTIRLFANGTEEVFHFPRRWWQDLNPFDHFTPERVAREGVGREWQDIRLFTSQSLRDNVAVAKPGHPGENPTTVLFCGSAVRRHERRVRADAEAVLGKLGLKGRESSSGDKVSLGQAKRVAIARAAQTGVRILFLDEPLAGLDRTGSEEVVNLLRDLAHRQSLTLVIVEHVFNVQRILAFATSVWTLKDTNLSVETPSHVTAQINAVTGAEGALGFIQTALGSNARCVGNTNIEGAVFSVFVQTEPKQGTQEKPLLEVTELIVYRGNRLAIGTCTEQGKVRGLSFSIHHGTLAVLLAPNGWGKTTLLEAIAGLIPIAAGEIRFNGMPIQALPTWRRAALGISFLQSRNHDYPNLTVGEVLRLSRIHTISDSIKRLLKRRMSELSGGEKRKVAIVSSFSQQAPNLAMLDEPFSALDHKSLQEVSASLRVDTSSASFVAFPSVER